MAPEPTNESETMVVATDRAPAPTGLAALAGNSLDDNFRLLVARGEAFSAEVEDLLHSITGQFRLLPHAPDPEQPLGGSLNWLIERLGLPTAHDVRLLRAQIDRLTREIERMM